MFLLLQIKKLTCLGLLNPVFIFILLWFALPTITFAQTLPKASPSASVSQLTPPTDTPPAGINVTLSPPFVNVTTDPGVPVASQFRVRNNNNFKEYYKLTLAKFISNEAGDGPSLQQLTSEDEFGKWISFSEDQFSVDINEQKTIKFTVSPPKEAALDYYYAILVERMINPNNPGGTVITGAPAFLTILEVRSPNAKRELQLVEFKTEGPFYEYLPSNFKIKLKNTGNLHLVPYGDVFIDWGGQKNIAVIPANPTKGNIIPGTTRTYNAYWNDGFIVREPKIDSNGVIIRNQDGNPVIETKVDWTKIAKFRIGLYTAHLLAVYDNGTRDIPLEATVSFWVLPWKIIGGFILIALILLFGLKSIVFSIFRSTKKR